VKLPVPLVVHLEEIMGAALRSVAPVSGGCIANAVSAEFQSNRMFLKWAATRDQPAALFSEEARSLAALAATRTVRVPQVIHQGTADGYAWLLLEWLEPGRGSARSQAQLGEQLAALHRSSAEKFGWPADNFIGSLPQSNRTHERWPHFWREERLLPQLARAAARLGAADRRRLEKLADQTSELLRDVAHEPPSLLHGDLWSGNLHVLADGAPAVIDPSSYYGHREVDLAMSRLFGGFSEEFYRAYEDSWPSAPGLEQRILLYQLYYLLVHVNLFGGGYTSQTMSVAAQLAARW
jgi:fructosamine-3-kinase